MRFTPVHKVIAAATSLAMLMSTIAIAPAAFAAGSPAPTTVAATNITSSNATLNGMNGDTDAAASAFWVSTSTFSVASSTSPVLPAGVYSTGGLPAVASSTAFSALLSSATIPAGLLPVTASTTYFFVAWTQVGTTWSPGAVLNFTTVSAPTVTNIAPNSGTTAGGTSVTITGTGFASGATVTIGGAAATGVIIASSTSITATAPAGTAGAQNVVVTNPDTGTITSIGGFTYVTPVVAAPTVTAVSPGTGTTAGGTSVTITGTNLTGAIAVNFGSNVATGVVVSSSTSITAISPATTTLGTVDVTVTTAGGTSATSTADHFIYTLPVPTAPVISNVVTTQNSTSSETITWNTDTAATGQVFYGTTSAYGASTTPEVTASTTHSVTITGLTEATVYHFKIQQTNAGGTSSTTDMVFSTQSTASSTPLAVTSVDSIQGTATADGTFGNGFKWVIHFTVPDNETSFQMKFADFTSSTTASTIPAASNIRIYSSQSSNHSSASSAVVSADNNYGTALTMSGDTNSAMPGRQVDVTVEVKVPVGTTPASYTTTFGTKTQ